MVREPLPGSTVEPRRKPVAVVLGEVGHALALGEILTQQAVGVLVGAALPRVVWGGEVKSGRRDSLESRVLVKFGPVVDRDRPYRMRMHVDERLRPSIHLGARALLRLAELQLPRLPLDQAQHARPGLAGAQHGVRLPMAHLGARVGPRGAGADQAPARATGPPGAA